MKQIDKIVKGIVEPKDINVLWLDTNDPKSPILKAYADGEWKAISSGEGGGGSAEGAVSYEPQELTDEQKMQARENQGLYYSTVGNEEKTSYFPQDNLKNQTWAYTITDEQIASLTDGADFITFIKVSDDCPQKEELVSLRVNNIDVSLLDPNNIVISGDSVVGYIKQETGYYYGVASEWGEDFFDAIFLVVTDDNVNNIELTGIHSVDGEGYAVANNLSKGIWAKLMVTPNGSSEESDWDIDFIGFSQFVYNGEVEQIVGVETKYTKAISYSEQQDLSVTQQMQARINQGLYAETKETVITFDGDLEKVTDYFPIYTALYMIKVSDRTDLDLNNIVGMSMFNTENGEQEFPDEVIKELQVITTADLNSYISFDVPVTILFGESNTPIAFITDGATITPYNEETPIQVSGLYVWGVAEREI